MGVNPSPLTHLHTVFWMAVVKRWTQKSKITWRARVCARARGGECTWSEKALLHIDALPVFPKIVVVFREKVGGFPTLCDDDDAKTQLVQRFLLPRTASVPMSDETFLMAWYLLWLFSAYLVSYLIEIDYICKQQSDILLCRKPFSIRLQCRK